MNNDKTITFFVLIIVAIVIIYITKRKKEVDELQRTLDIAKKTRNHKKHRKTFEYCRKKQWFKRGFIASFVIFALLCIVELANPSMGWIRF